MNSQRGCGMSLTAQEPGVKHATKLAKETRHEGSRREALRLATLDLHRSLDATVASYELRRIDHYSAFLAASAGPLLALEQMLETAGVQEVLPEWQERRRSEIITRDLS